MECRSKVQIIHTRYSASTAAELSPETTNHTATMCVYEGFKYTCGHTIYERRSTCWGWFWEKLHYVDCCYALVTCTGGMPPACETETYIKEMDMKCFKCQEEEIEAQRKRPREYQYPLADLPPTSSQFDMSLSDYTQGNYSPHDPPGFQAQQGMQYPQGPPVAASQQQTPLPSPAVRESRFNRGQSQNLGTKVMSPAAYLAQETAYHGNLSQSSNRGESKSRRRHSSQGPSSTSHRSQHSRPQRSRSQPRDGSRRESTSQDQRPHTQNQNGSRLPSRRESRSRDQRSHSQHRDGSRSRRRRGSTSRGERPPLSARGRPTYYNDPTPTR